LQLMNFDISAANVLRSEADLSKTDIAENEEIHSADEQKQNRLPEHEAYSNGVAETRQMEGTLDVFCTTLPFPQTPFCCMMFPETCTPTTSPTVTSTTTERTTTTGASEVFCTTLPFPQTPVCCMMFPETCPTTPITTSSIITTPATSSPPKTLITSPPTTLITDPPTTYDIATLFLAPTTAITSPH
jgi:hypothetical protein